MESNKLKFPVGLIGIAAGAYAIYYFAKKFKEIFTGSEEQQKELQTFGNSSYWDINYWKAPGALILKDAAVTDFINKLNSAPGTFNDNEEQVYSVFRALNTKSQVSYLAYKWSQGSNISLYDYLTKFLSDKELYTVKKIIDSKPNYKH
jgi:hypothetical protein